MHIKQKPRNQELEYTLFGDSYCLENMLLDPVLVHEALIELRGKAAPPSLDDVKDMLSRSIERIKSDIGGVYVTKTQAAYRDLN